jgi:phosphatidylglycerophosphatase A
MRNSNGLRNIIKLIVSVFYLGYIPYIPGTLTSAVALLIFYFFYSHKIFLFSIWFTSGILGFVFCDRAIAIFKEKDPKSVVIDEFFAMLFALMFTPLDGYYHMSFIRPSLLFFILVFIIFRIIDIFKFWPIKAIEKQEGSLGIMLDDCIAAVYTIIIVRILIFFARLIFSV